MPFKILYHGEVSRHLNTDNRLMSSTSMTQEFEAAANTFDLSLDDFEKITINADEERVLTLQATLRLHLLDHQPAYANIAKSTL